MNFDQLSSSMPRSADLSGTFVLGLVALLIPVLGPVVVVRADEELAHMRTGQVAPTAQTWVLVAKALGVLASLLAASATALLIVFALA